MVIKRYLRRYFLIGLGLLVLSGFFISTIQNVSIAADINVGLTIPNLSGGGGGDNSPTIFGVTSTVNYTTATIMWTAADDRGIATTSFAYGLTNAYGDAGVVSGSYQVQLNNLATGTLYYFNITVTDTGGHTTTQSGSFQTQTLSANPDTTPPPNVFNVRLTTTSQSIILQWSNPSLVTFPDFSGVRVIRQVNSPSLNISDGVMLYNGVEQMFVDDSVVSGVTYYYTIFSFDTSLNYSTGVYVSGSIATAVPPPVKLEICGNGIDDDNNGRADCADAVCAPTSACQINANELCANGLDDDKDGAIDCADNDCSLHSACQRGNSEMCGNNLDDDGDGSIDCADSDCVGYNGCTQQKPISPYQPPPITVPNFVHLNLERVLFLAGNQHIQLTPSHNSVVSLAGSEMTIRLPVSALASFARVTVTLDGQDRQPLVYDASSLSYSTTIIVPNIGARQGYIEINYGAAQTDVINFILEGLGYGSISDGKNLLANVEITLLDESGSSANMTDFGERNPWTTNINGNYGWVAPNGTYRLQFKKPGFYSKVTSPFAIYNNIINSSWKLYVQPPSLSEVIDVKAPVVKNIKNITTNLLNKAGVNIIRVKENQAVQQVTGKVVVPAVVSLTAAAAASFISWADLVALLRFLFLQPLLLLGWRKRQGWGVVYNALNKLPIDLATVRLINAVNNKVVQSKVTGKLGRYAFFANPGIYRLEIVKNNFTFPSKLLRQFKDDGRRTDIYHGEIIEVGEKNVVITANIPLDPTGELQAPRRLAWYRAGRFAQLTLSWLGILITAISFYISPHWYVGILLGAHILFFLVFRRLAIPPKVKSWGIVYDAETNGPLARVVARLFSAQFNKMVSTQITDHRGRYYFLAGDNKYYVTYEHNNYKPEKTGVLDLTGKEEENIAPDITLKKNKKLLTGTDA